MAHILHKVRPPEDLLENNKAIWIVYARGKFTVKPAWQYVRQREIVNNFYKQL